MSATNLIPEGSAPIHIEVICGGVSTQFDAEEIRITLPNGIVFNLYRSLASESIRADIPVDGPDAEEVPVFLLSPGATNLLLINAERRAVLS